MAASPTAQSLLRKLPLTRRQIRVAALYWGERARPAHIGPRFGMTRQAVCEMLKRIRIRLAMNGFKVPPKPDHSVSYRKLTQLSACKGVAA